MNSIFHRWDQHATDDTSHCLIFIVFNFIDPFDLIVGQNQPFVTAPRAIITPFARINFIAAGFPLAPRANIRRDFRWWKGNVLMFHPGLPDLLLRINFLPILSLIVGGLAGIHGCCSKTQGDRAAHTPVSWCPVTFSRRKKVIRVGS